MTNGLSRLYRQAIYRQSYEHEARMLIKGRTEVAASPASVYAALIDPAAWFKLDRTLVDVIPREKLSLGSTGTLRNRRALGFVASARWTTTELIPDVRVTQHLRGSGYELTETVSLAATATGTDLAVIDDLTPTSIGGRVLVAFARGIMERDLAARFAGLRRLLEPGDAAGA